MTKERTEAQKRATAKLLSKMDAKHAGDRLGKVDMLRGTVVGIDHLARRDKWDAARKGAAFGEAVKVASGSTFITAVEKFGDGVMEIAQLNEAVDANLKAKAEAKAAKEASDKAAQAAIATAEDATTVAQ